MAEENNTNRYYPPCGIRVCVDREGETLAGRMYSRMTEKEISFESTFDLLLKADNLFDQVGYPQRFMEPRSFQQKTETTSHYHLPREVTPTEQILEQEGKCETFDIFVESRRKAGWQGRVSTRDRSSSKEFQSEMELLNIIDQMIPL